MYNQVPGRAQMMGGVRPMTHNMKSQREMAQRRSIMALGNMNPSNLAFGNPIQPMGSPFVNPNAYGMMAPGMLPPPIPGVPGQIPPFDRTPR